MFDIQDKPMAIRQLQTWLLELSYFMEEMPRVAIDGIYGDETRRAVRVYRRLKGLDDSDIVDLIVWLLLYDDYLEAKAQRLGLG